jgi:hypothetical protein
VQRQEEPEEEEEMLQAKSSEDATPEVSNDLESQINAIKGGGRPVAESERDYFEPRFGADFSLVRMHSDAQVAESARAVNAKAYTIGKDVVFQDLVGVNVTGTFDETTVRAIAHIQRTFGLGSDGKVGPNTYDLLIRELQAEHTAPGTCLTLFQIVGPEPLRFFRSTTNLNHGTMGSRFSVRARFDPRCRCGNFEYRQYIAGSVVLHDLKTPLTAAPVILNNRFNVPGGLAGALREDGDTNIAPNVAGHHYGHRYYADNPSDNRDRYLPDRRTGCEYEGYDFPELGPIPAAAGDAGDRYEWTMRFRGVIKRRGRGEIEEKYWVIRGPVVIP